MMTMSVLRFCFLFASDVLVTSGLYIPRPDAVYAEPGSVLDAAIVETTDAALRALWSSSAFASDTHWCVLQTEIVNVWSRAAVTFLREAAPLTSYLLLLTSTKSHFVCDSHFVMSLYIWLS